MADIIASISDVIAAERGMMASVCFSVIASIAVDIITPIITPIITRIRMTPAILVIQQ